jgi:hypothetical protein
MEKDTRNKIAGLNEGIQEELDLLTKDLQYRVGTITKYKDEILKLLDSESVQNASLEESFPCCKGECDCHMFIGGSGKPCPDCSSNLNKTSEDKR